MYTVFCVKYSFLSKTTNSRGKPLVTLILHPELLKQLSYLQCYGRIDHHANEPETRLKQLLFIAVSFQSNFTTCLLAPCWRRCFETGWRIIYHCLISFSFLSISFQHRNVPVEKVYADLSC
jgi:hypothetical protein